MKIEELLAIARKYRKLAYSTEVRFEKDPRKYERFADFIEENKEDFEDEYYETEKELFRAFREAESEIEAQWEAMYPDGYNLE